MAYEFIDDQQKGRYQFLDAEATQLPANAPGKNAPNVIDRDTYLQQVQARKDAGPGFFEKGGTAQNIGGGGFRGAGSIGSTLLSLTPFDKVPEALDISRNAIAKFQGKPPPVELRDRDAERRAEMDAGLRTIGANPDALAFKGAKLGTEVAGTAGLGGVFGNLLLRAAPAVSTFAPSVANVMTRLAPAVQSGGLTLGANAPTNVLANAALRASGGGINGLVSAGLVNPDDAGAGAAFGAALPGAIKVAGKAGSLLNQGVSGATKNFLGLTTGAGAGAVGTAYQSGKAGGTSFLDNMRGNVPMTDVLDSAKDALSKMRIERGNQYRSGMVDIAKDKSVINFAPIDNAVNSLKTMGSFKGQVINKNAAGTVDEISGLVNQWKNLDPAEYHTPEGLDALKKAIGDVRDATQFGTPGRKAADTAYNAVKGQIDMQAPTYSKVMKDYSQASDTLTEIEKSLSLGNKAAADTSMRKLQSLMRNNVNTNYGNRLGLAKELEQTGADILTPVAGQALSSWTPRGLQSATSVLAAIPTSGASLATASPRLVGELAYALGSTNRGISNAGSATANQLAKLLGANPSAKKLTMSELAPLLATAGAVTASQR